MSTDQATTEAERLGLSAAEVVYASHLGRSLEEYAAIKHAIAPRAGVKRYTLESHQRAVAEGQAQAAVRAEAEKQIAVDAEKKRIAAEAAS